MSVTKHPKLCDADMHAKLYGALLSDKVVNVQFSACKMLHEMKSLNPKLHGSTLDSCKGAIEQLTGSNDPDSEYFAKLCLGRVDNVGRDL